MIKYSKNNENFRNPQIAGMLPGDSGIELMGIKVKGKKTTLWMQNGCTHYFTDLPSKIYNLIKTAYLLDHKAVEFISKIHIELKDQVELYAYYMWGDVDDTPDILNGVLAPSENFREKRDCPSLRWNAKNITIDTYILTPRDIVMIDMMADCNDYIDAVIAEAIGVSHSHYDTLKRKLFTYTNTHSKHALLLKAKTQKVI
jgi:DNA-binding CsgD family transcriptional regulator